MMDAELKRKWVEALRSGKYKQTKGGLRDEDGHCCLGVLCDVSGLGAWRDCRDDECGRTRCEFDFVTGQAADDMIPILVLERIGLHPTDQERCWRMNDEEWNSFAEIADYIERKL